MMLPNSNDNVAWAALDLGTVAVNEEELQIVANAIGWELSDLNTEDGRYVSDFDKDRQMRAAKRALIQLAVHRGVL